MVSLMGEMFLLMFTGYIARRTGIITKDGKLCLTNLIFSHVILPCNIVKAFMNEKGTDWASMLQVLILAVYIGIFIMLSNLALPAFLSSTITVISSCTTAMTMIYIGTILTETSLRTLVSKDQIFFAVLRPFSSQSSSLGNAAYIILI